MSGETNYTLDDPRPIAAEAPYTYFLPAEARLASLEPGDFVKLVFRPNKPGLNWEAERMWVLVESIHADGLRGRLANEPEDVAELHYDDEVRFQRWHVIDIQWSDDRSQPPPFPPAPSEYWERCLIDRCVTEGGARVHFLYREEPDPPVEGEPLDSGWRIRGDYRESSDAEIDTREVEFIALGKVLNIDDSWIHLIDEPVGSCFIRDWETDGFVPEQAE
jgi:hypothetical protein